MQLICVTTVETRYSSAAIYANAVLVACPSLSSKCSCRIMSGSVPCAVACRLFCKLCFVSGYVRLANVPANALAYFFFNFFVSFRSFLSSDFTFLSIFLRSSSAGKFSGLIPLFSNSPLTS